LRGKCEGEAHGKLIGQIETLSELLGVPAMQLDGLGRFHRARLGVALTDGSQLRRTSARRLPGLQADAEKCADLAPPP